MPNFLSIDTNPFDRDTYDERAVEEVLDDDGKARVRLRVENTIRWRYAKGADGQLKRDANVCAILASGVDYLCPNMWACRFFLSDSLRR